MIWIDGLFVILVFVWLVSCLMIFIVCLGKAGMITQGPDNKTRTDAS